MRFLRDPVFLKRFHAAATVFFLVQIPIALFTGLKDSVPYLVGISLWALVASHWAAWQSTSIEVKQDADANVQDVLDELRKNPDAREQVCEAD